MNDRRIYLGMPGYGKQTADAGRSFWRACRDMSQVTNEYRCGSLLASNFNSLWCGALNEVHAGRRVDYFAMLHDDISADDYWLDAMIAELEDRELDVLGAVVPIKDTRGITSLALHKDGDNWMPTCRLAMHEIYKLPETFTGEDIGYPLLLNTGCWVCRFDMRWAKLVHFEINDRIVFNTALNMYQAQTEPEDWFFSRLCHEQGLRIGATRKVGIMHRGEMDFPNTGPWGSCEFDREHAKMSPLPGAFPYDIKGWLRPEEGEELSRLAAGKRVLEIGSYCGLSTICMARTAKHVTAVDYFDGRGTPLPADTRREFEQNLERYGVADKVAICHPESTYPLGEYDVAFIDGAHDHDSVIQDAARASELLTSDGILIFHDYMQSTDPGVTTAVSTMVLRGAEIVSQTGSLAVVKPALSLLEAIHA